ncbi:MAG: GspE/PulE family protein [bacterium]
MMHDGDQGDSTYFLLSTEEKIKQGLVGDRVVDLVDAILHQAIEQGASDVHFQPDGHVLRIRYRIDGILYDRAPVAHELWFQVISRIKVISALDIAEKRVPQDGKFKVSMATRRDSIDFRVSTFPSIYGEKLVVRILDRSSNLLSLDSLGFSAQNLAAIKAVVTAPYGFFLVTGPTGAGKTTTLYAILSSLNSAEKNIITMEDPVEYDLSGITQSQVNRHTGFMFENGLRSILRQDPDIIMIGEIRDAPTVSMAIESALTGHLVLSTLHTNDAAGVITRLIDMGVEPFLINASLSGVLAQRLARKLCDYCKKEVIVTSAERVLAEKNGVQLKRLFKATGCKHCLNLGYKGRVGLFEFLMPSEGLRQCISGFSGKMSHKIIREQAIQDGMVSLFHDGISKVNQGIISLEELVLVAGSV